MPKNYIEEKKDAFELLIRYRAFERLILRNYPFDQDWLVSFLYNNHSEDDFDQIACLNENENLKINWTEMYNSGLGFINHLNIRYNKVAIYELEQLGIKLSYSAREDYEILPNEIKLSKNFGVKDLSNFLDKGIGNDVVFDLREVWDHLFKDIFDERMMQAWFYHRCLLKDIENYYSGIRNNLDYDLLEKYYDNADLQQYEHDEGQNSQHNIINDALKETSIMSGMLIRVLQLTFWIIITTQANIHNICKFAICFALLSHPSANIAHLYHTG